MFTLGRPDVLPSDDLGVRKGAQSITGRALTPKAARRLWRPLGALALRRRVARWRATDTVTMDKKPKKPSRAPAANEDRRSRGLHPRQYARADRRRTARKFACTSRTTPSRFGR